MYKISNKGIKHGKLGAPTNKEKKALYQNIMKNMVDEIIHTGVLFYTHRPANPTQVKKTTSRSFFVSNMKSFRKKTFFIKREKESRVLSCKGCGSNLYHQKNSNIITHLIMCLSNLNIRSYSKLDPRSQLKYSSPASNAYVGKQAFPLPNEIDGLLERIKNSAANAALMDRLRSVAPEIMSNQVANGPPQIFIETSRITWWFRDLINKTIDDMEANLPTQKSMVKYKSMNPSNTSKRDDLNEPDVQKDSLNDSNQFWAVTKRSKKSSQVSTNSWIKLL